MEIKKIISIIIIIANIGLVQAQYTAIPDPCFEQYLIDLGIDTQGTLDAQVLTADVMTVTELNVENIDEQCWIQNIHGIDAFTSLITLNVTSNGLQHLDLSSLPNLKNLYCNKNYILTLALPPSIEIVSAGQNRFTQTIDLSQTTLLRELDIHGYVGGFQSHITSLDLSNCILLTKLNVLNNNLTSIDISTNVLLKEMWANRNQIDTFTHNNNALLERLSLGSNSFTSLDVTNLIGLKIFYLGHYNFHSFNNEIESIDLSQNINLERLYVRNDNVLTNIDLRNGQNNLITNLHSENTPNLTCIYVDDAQYSQTNWQQGGNNFSHDANNTFVETEAECEALAVNETTIENEFIFYPNPVKNILHIKNESPKIKEITIFDVLGKAIFKTSETIIDFTAFSNGLYVVSIQTNDNTIVTKKIIKVGE